MTDIIQISVGSPGAPGDTGPPGIQGDPGMSLLLYTYVVCMIHLVHVGFTYTGLPGPPCPPG